MTTLQETSFPHQSLTLTSSAFSSGNTIPLEFTCKGDGNCPPLEINGVPKETETLALLFEDPDVPKDLMPEGVYDHWVLFNIDPSTTEISADEVPLGALQGANTRGAAEYAPPCPPDSEHRYTFYLFALDTWLDLEKGATKEEVLAALNGCVIDSAQLMGLVAP